MRYRTVPEGQLRWAEFGGDYVVLHLPSGKTHFLNATSAVLLLDVLKEPHTATEATAALLATQDMPPDDAQHEYVSSLLQRFAELGIIDG